MIRRVAVLILLLGLGVECAWAQGSFPLLNGEVLSGEPVHFNAQGVIFKRGDNTFTARTSWTNFTEPALKELGKDAKAKPFVDQYLEAAEEEEPDKKAAEITVKPPPRLERPNLKAGIGAVFTSPLSLVLLFLFWAANIYAAYEIALFRNYPWMLVCGITAVVPVIGPVLFLCLPTYIRPAETEEELEGQQHAHEVPIADQVAAAATVEAVAAPAAPTGPPHTVFKRGQTTFNRRFFETKLANFLRVTPTEAEKDMVVYIKSARGEHTGSRIVRITPNELYLLVFKAGASQEVMIPFTEIAEVHVKHKDA